LNVQYTVQEANGMVCTSEECSMHKNTDKVIQSNMAVVKSSD